MITFLFGAGAELDYGAPAGSAFAEALIKNRYSNEIKALLGSKCSYRLLYPASKSFYIDTVKQNKEEAKHLFSEIFIDDRKDLYSVLAEDSRGDSDENTLIAEQKRICLAFYRLLKSDMEKDSDDALENDERLDSQLMRRGKEIKDFFYKRGVFYTALDSRFNNLRYDFFNTEAKSVVGAYLTILLEMVGHLYPREDSNNQLLSTWGSLFSILEKEYYFRDEKDDTYYEILRNSGLERNHYHLATTNYTRFISKVFKEDKNRVSFLHGKMTWFEDRRNLLIYDLDTLSERKKLAAIPNKEDTLIPFILIPSGVKPIICTKQLNEYCRFVGQLKESDTLCVLGYRLNSEDNDINAIISNWLREKPGNHLIVFNHNESIDLSRVPWIPKEKTSILSCGDSRPNSWIVKQFSKQVTEIVVDDNNSKEAFASYISEYREGIKK